MSEEIKYSTMLPDGWALLKFKETCEKVSLNGIKIKQKQYLVSGKYPVVDQGQDIIGGYFNDETFVVPYEPPYIVFGDHTKVKKYINFKFIAGADGVKVIKPYEYLLSKLLYHFLHCIKLPDKGYARHFQFFEKSEFPLPPLPEQHRIVAKIEELFSSLDKGIENLKTAQAQLKTYRQAVLKWAFEGKLTNENVKVGELPEGWKWVKISDAGKVQLGRQRSPKNVSNHYPTKYIRAANITKDGLDISDVLEMEFNPKEFVNYQLHYGDIVLSEASGSPTQLGKPAIWKNQIADCCFQNTVIRLRPNKIAASEFLYLLFKSFYENGYFAKIAGGVGINHLSAGKFSNMEIPLPPTLPEQHRIVSEIETRLSVCDKLEESIAQGLVQAEALRQSILKKAFEGKLVPQNPEDEPASVLLERIRAERASISAKKEATGAKNAQVGAYGKGKRKRT